MIRNFRLLTIQAAIIGLLGVMWLARPVEPVVAHGTLITYSVQATVQIEALFETGEPMANAQITVYSPADPSNAWLQGEADENGLFSFAPDPEIPGQWGVSVRSAGHGQFINIPISNDAAGISLGGATNGGQSILERLVIGGSVIWGFVGTALYFYGRQTPRKLEKEE